MRDLLETCDQDVSQLFKVDIELDCALLFLEVQSLEAIHLIEVGRRGIDVACHVILDDLSSGGAVDSNVIGNIRVNIVLTAPEPR